MPVLINSQITAMDVVFAAYIATLLCVIIVEFYPRGRIGHVAALSSIALVSLGGAAWSYAAFYQRSEWPEVVAQKYNDDGAGGPGRQSSRPGRDIDDAAEADRDGGSGGGSGKRGNARSASGGGGAGGAGNTILERVLGLASQTEADDDALIRDCESCPPLIAVPAGSSIIGADDKDPDASSPERPQYQVKVWPGFYISAEPVTAQSFRQFQNESYRKPRICGVETANLAPPTGTLAVAVQPIAAATCVTPGDADAYVTWLTARTGKRFRLPTAVEWEYAARVLPASGPTAGMTTGGVAEIVADCWQSQLPPAWQRKDRGSNRVCRL